jgi:hypothetical protein
MKEVMDRSPQHGGAFLALVLTLAAAALLSISVISESAYAQPSWSFRANVTGTLYPGEEGTVRVSILNTECVRRERVAVLDYTRYSFVRNVEEGQIEIIKGRLEELKSIGLIRSYLIAENSSQLIGSKVYFNLTVFVYDYCRGSNAQVLKARIWFPWPGYGRSYNSEVTVGRTLPPFDVLAYVVTGSTSGFRIDLSFNFKVPKDLASELLVASVPVVEIDAIVTRDVYTFGGPFGLREVTVTGSVEIKPFRTFELLIVDSEGKRPLPQARLKLQAHVYPFSLELQADRDGKVAINRLPDQYSYRVYVLFRTPAVVEEIPVLVTDIDARDLAASEVLRTELYTVRVLVGDLKGRPVEGADVTLKPIEVIYAKASVPVSAKTSGEGLAEFPLISRGNYSVSVERLRVEVFSTHLYVGYHPTYGFREPRVKAVARLDDLNVSIVDGKGRPLPAEAVVSMKGTDETLVTIRTSDGRLELRQIPVTDYVIRVSVATSLGGRVAVEEIARPGDGATVTVRVPVYRVRLEVHAVDGRPLPNGTAVVDGAEFQLKEGSLELAAVREGVYGLSVRFMGLEVFKGSLAVSGDVDERIEARVYGLRLRFLDAEGKPVEVSWKLRAEGLEASGSGSSVMMDFVPDMYLELSVTYRFLNASVEVLRLAERTELLSGREGREELRLPLGRLRVAVSWDYGAPFSGNMRLIAGGQEVTVRLRNGRFESDAPFPFGNYSYRLIGGAGAVLGSGGFDHKGEVVTITVRTVKISVSVKDLLGMPLPGAQVSVLKGGTSYGTGTTDRSGTVTFARLPEALVPYSVEVRIREHSETKLASGVVSFEVPYIYVMDATLSPLEIGAIGGVTAAALVSLAIYSIRRTRR